MTQLFSIFRFFAIVFSISLCGGCGITAKGISHYYYPSRIPEQDPVIRERHFSGTEAAFREDILAKISGMESGDALERLAESGFKCKILTCYWLDAIYSPREDSADFHARIYIIQLDGADLASDDNVHITVDNTSLRKKAR
jgi:hypothetical protein